MIQIERETVLKISIENDFDTVIDCLADDKTLDTDEIFALPNLTRTRQILQEDGCGYMECGLWLIAKSDDLSYEADVKLRDKNLMPFADYNYKYTEFL